MFHFLRMIVFDCSMNIQGWTFTNVVVKARKQVGHVLYGGALHEY